MALTAANASGLALASGAVTSRAATHPCPGQATATAATGSGSTYSAVSVTVPAGCAGDRLSLTLLNGATVLRSGTTTVSGSGATTVTFTGTYTATATLTVLATVDGWNLPTTWSFTAPVLPAVSCAPIDPAVTATCDVVVTGWNFWGTGYRMDFSVTTTSATAFEWEVRLDLSRTDYPAPGGQTLFPGYPVPAGSWWSSWTPAGYSQSNLCSSSGAGDLPVLRLRGAYGWNRMVSAGSPATGMGIQVVAASGGTVASFACP